MTPEEAFDKVLKKWQKLAKGNTEIKVDTKCGFCWLVEHLNSDCADSCPAIQHFGVVFCVEDIPAVDRAYRAEPGPELRKAAREVVALLKENKAGLIAAGHQILEEVANEHTGNSS